MGGGHRAGTRGAAQRRGGAGRPATRARPGTTIDLLATLLAADVRKSLRRKREDRGRIVIYGPSGELLRIVEVNETADGDALPPSDRAPADS
jgi:Mg-chelatase subunit ChlD